MPRLDDKPFKESCCDGGQCNLDGQSAQPCGCDAKAKWVCAVHQQERDVRTPVKPVNAPSVPTYVGKVCPRGHDGTRYRSTRKCVECSKLYLDKRSPEAERVRQLNRARKKLPVPTRPCPEKCELCGGPSGKRAFHLDHDHKTRQFRGWLCGRCNTSLGRFGDTAQGLLQAVQYIQRNTNQTGLPTDAATRKQYPIATGVLDYFPLAIAEIAHVSWVGNEQHNPGKTLHWDRTKSSDEADAMMRHFKDRGTLDTDGMRHSAKMAWRALALLQKEIENERK